MCAHSRLAAGHRAWRPSPDGLQQILRLLGLLTGHPGQVQHSQAETLALLLEAEAHRKAATHQVIAVLGAGDSPTVSPEVAQWPPTPTPGLTPIPGLPQGGSAKATPEVALQTPNPGPGPTQTPT